MPIIALDLPVLFEDEGQEETGESEPHLLTLDILYNGIKAHLANQPDYRAFGDINCHYHPRRRKPYVTPDVMVVRPPAPLPRLTSYTIGVHGPAPVLTVEVLSRRSAQQQDRTNKPRLYARLGVAEYLMIDVTGQFLPQRLCLRRRRGPRSWEDTPTDADGGVTSALGFRVVIDPDGDARVIHATTGHRYPRPGEADTLELARQQAEERAAAAEDQARAEAETRRQAEERNRQLEAEIARLRGTRQTETGP
jgi:Uma2 family endonuclease